MQRGWASNLEIELQLGSAELLSNWVMQMAFATGILLNFALSKKVLYLMALSSATLYQGTI